MKETTETANCTDTSAIPKRRPSHAFINMTGSDARSSFGYYSSNPRPPIKMDRKFLRDSRNEQNVRKFLIDLRKRQMPDKFSKIPEKD